MVESPYEMAMLLSVYDTPAGEYITKQMPSYDTMMAKMGASVVAKKHIEVYEGVINEE